MVARPNAALAQIHTQIMWSRLIAVVEEQAQTMLRTAFSTSVRQYGWLLISAPVKNWLPATWSP